MTDALLYSPAVWSYGFAAIVFVTFGLRLCIGWRGGARAIVLLVAVASSALWAGSVVYALGDPGAVWWTIARLLDVAHLGAWLAFLALLLRGWREGSVASTWATASRWLLAGTVLLLAAGALLPQAPPLRWFEEAERPIGAVAALLGIAILGLALCEQLYRRTPEHGRWAIKPLVIGLAGMFAFDLFLYSDALLFGHLDPAIWAARGVAHAAVIFFVAMATARNTSWTIDLHLSRGVVFHSTALLAAGVYMLIVAGAGYWMRHFGGSWGTTLQIAFVFTALLFLGGVALSGSLRARLRVFISKNFFSYRYDYRGEWLRFTRLLAAPTPGQSLHEQLVRALADLVESLGGTLWLEREGAFREVARINLPQVGQVEPVAGSLVSFLARTGWVIRLDEFARSPDRYPGLVLPAWLSASSEAWLVVPLPSGNEVIGFVVLARPRTPVDVNWEVLDLLKTASRQAASYLAQIRTNEALLEAQKFDAFNRMSAFVVHDLKNLIAQLSLMMKNAERHRANPEFQRDMLKTVEHVVGRMNHLMLQLRSGTTPMEKPRPVDLGEAIGRIARAKRSERVGLEVETAPGLRALGHEDRIERVIGHLVQNAFEATTNDNAPVTVRAFAEGAHAVVEVIDRGAGMTQDFVRERLFRPFQTTKAQGMGIGMYESAQYVSGIGGRIAVESSPDAGTRFRVFLPLAGASVLAAETLREVA